MSRQSLQTVAGVFGRCFLISIALQALFTLLWIYQASDWAVDLHSKLFNIPPAAVKLEVYRFFALWKLLNFLLLLVPWAGLSLKARSLPE